MTHTIYFLAILAFLAFLLVAIIRSSINFSKYSHMDMAYRKACMHVASDYTSDEGWFMVVLRWNDTGDCTTECFYDNDGKAALDYIVGKYEDDGKELNTDYSIVNIVRLTHKKNL